jgi:hypothetical protein
VPEKITTENVEAIIRAQNPEVLTNDDNIEAKYRFKNKRGRYNIVMEVGPQKREQLLQTKNRMGDV